MLVLVHLLFIKNKFPSGLKKIFPNFFVKKWWSEIIKIVAFFNFKYFFLWKIFGIAIFKISWRYRKELFGGKKFFQGIRKTKNKKRIVESDGGKIKIKEMPKLCPEGGEGRGGGEKGDQVYEPGREK